MRPTTTLFLRFASFLKNYPTTNPGFVQGKITETMKISDEAPILPFPVRCRSHGPGMTMPHTKVNFRLTKKRQFTIREIFDATVRGISTDVD